ncbi:MAG: SIR2 family protein [Culicoidibacterales bacterium]
MHITEFISSYKNYPVLFVGTGLSLRYLNNSYTWENLLKHIMSEISDNNEAFLDIKAQSLTPNREIDYSKMAATISNLFDEYLSKGENRHGKFKEVNDIYYANLANNVLNSSRFKIYLSLLFKNLDFKEDMSDERNALLKIRKNIGSVITTNYDKLIEDVFQFEPLIGNNILLSNPYGSVYKIHGCTDNPESIIMTTDDYNNFDKKYELIRAQLLSLFIHNPIIFLGYNIGDENIRNLLRTIFTYVTPNSDIAEQIKSNFLLVEYEKNSENESVQEHDIELADNTTIRVNKIKTDNFTAIYNALSSIQLPVSAMDIRKVQNIVKEIYTGGNIKVNILDNLNDIHNGDFILAAGNINRIKYEYQNTSEMMANYFNIISEDNKQLLDLIDKHKIQKNQFFPIFGFSQINSNIQSSSKLKIQQVEKLKNIVKYPTIHSNINDILADDSISNSKKEHAIISAVLEKNISLPEIEAYLQSYSEKETTSFRKILCAYDFMKYADNTCLE